MKILNYKLNLSPTQCQHENIGIGGRYVGANISLSVKISAVRIYLYWYRPGPYRSNPSAFCVMLHFLCLMISASLSMHFILGILFYSYALCISYYAFHSMIFVPCLLVDIIIIHHTQTDRPTDQPTEIVMSQGAKKIKT